MGREFDELFEQYSDRLYRLCFAITGNAPDAEDALQETFAAVHRGLGSFREQASPYTWLYRVALRAAIRVRSRQRRHAPIENSAAHRANNLDPRPDLESRQALQHGLARLTAEQRTLLAFVVSGLNHQEIAAILGVPVGTIWSRVHQARRSLADSIKG